jgi:hypothetical protein
MANRFEKGVWPDRQTQYTDRRRQIPTTDANVFDIERVEGEVLEPGKAFNQENMESLENRIYNAFDTLESSDIKMTDAGNIFTATTVDGALSELFSYAGNGKTAVATAIGSEVSTSDTFQTLASTISNGKLAIANALGDASWQTGTFGWLAYMANFYRTEALAKRRVLMQQISIVGTAESTSNITKHVNINFGFVPTKVIVVGVKCRFGLNGFGYISYGNVFDNTGYSQDTVANISSSGFDMVLTSWDSKQFLADTAYLIAIE